MTKGDDDDLEVIRQFWDLDAATYDRAVGHRPRHRAERAAWLGALERLLPPAPADVLDCGAGTGFLSLMAARLGHRVTAVDLSEKMLDQLRRSADQERLDLSVVVGPADRPPGVYDAIIERHLLWTLPDPVSTLRAWRRAAPQGRVVLIGSTWGSPDPVERARAGVRDGLRRWRRVAPDHHARYPDELQSRLPLGAGAPPEEVIEVLEVAGWRNARLERLRDVEWAATLHRSVVDRMVGVAPRFAVWAQ